MECSHSDHVLFSQHIFNKGCFYATDSMLTRLTRQDRRFFVKSKKLFTVIHSLSNFLIAIKYHILVHSDPFEE